MAFSTHEDKRLILIPAPLGSESLMMLDSTYLTLVLKTTNVWIAESARTLRRFLSACNLNIDLDILVIEELNNAVPIVGVLSFLDKHIQNQNVGLISEAGMPALADPGAQVVAHAHKKRYKVEVLPGPSSIIMALCGSGFSGQEFQFHGYSPVKQEALKPFLNKLLQQAKSGSTQIWMDTPYRSDRMLEMCLQLWPDQAWLAAAVSLHTQDEKYYCMRVSDWKKRKIQFGKAPVVFSTGELQG